MSLKIYHLVFIFWESVNSCEGLAFAITQNKKKHNNNWKQQTQSDRHWSSKFDMKLEKMLYVECEEAGWETPELN